MSTITYLDGTQLTSTALSKSQMELAMQIATCQMLGLVAFTVSMALVENSNVATPANMGNLAVGQSLKDVNLPVGTTITVVGDTTIEISSVALATSTDNVVVGNPGVFSAVRIAWQQQGQPGWGVNQDVCIVRAVPTDTEFSRMRDAIGAAQDTVITFTDGYTRTWRVYWSFYGPNSLPNSKFVQSGLITIQLIADLLAVSNLYVNPSIEEPRRVPENFQGEWWERCDLSALFNEQITETYTTGTVEVVEVIGYTEAGKFTDITVTPT